MGMRCAGRWAGGLGIVCWPIKTLNNEYRASEVSLLKWVRPPLHPSPIILGWDVDAKCLSHCRAQEAQVTTGASDCDANALRIRE